MYIISKGSLFKKGNTLYFENKNEKFSIPIKDLKEIYFFNDVNITSQALNFCGKLGILLHFFDHYGFYRGSFFPKISLLSGNMLILQSKAYLDFDYRIRLAKSFVIGAMKNISVNLRTFKLDNSFLEDYLNKIESVKDISSLMGLEGNFRSLYYNQLDKKLGEFDFLIEKRSRRPPKNEANSLLSFLNMLLYTKIIKNVYYTHLNPTISYLHEPWERRFSLALDISEIFKPIISERVFVNLITKKIIRKEDFDKRSLGILIKENAKKKILKEFDTFINKTVKHKTLRKNVSYEHLIRLEIYKLEKDFLGLKKYKPLIAWW